MSQHFNGLTPAEAERLAMLIEECGEVIHVAGKILRHGYASHNPNDPQKRQNIALLRDEVADLCSVLDLMEHDGLGEVRFEATCALREKKLRFSHHQKD